MKKLLLILLLAAPLVAQDRSVKVAYPEVAYTADELKEAAIAHWEFDDNRNLGYEGGDTSEPVADFESGSSQEAGITTGATFARLGDGVSWGVAFWLQPESFPAALMFLAAHATSLADAAGEWDSYVATATGNWNCRIYDGSGQVVDYVAGVVAVGSKVFLHCRYNADTNELEAGSSATWSGTPGSTAADGTAADHPFGFPPLVGTYPVDGLMGPGFFYRSASGGEVLTDAITTSLYNGGKGKTCDQLSASEQVNLVSCWNLTEAPSVGTYSDSIGSNDLTAVNGPIAQGPGLVRTGSGDSTLDLSPQNSPAALGGATGDATYMLAVSSQYADGNDNPDFETGPGISYAFAGWLRIDAISSFGSVMSKIINGGTPGDWDGYISTAGQLTCRHVGTGPAPATDVMTGVPVGTGERAFVHCRYNADTNELEAGLNAVWTGSPFIAANDGDSGTGQLNVGSYADGSGHLFNHTRGQLLYYRSTSGGEVLTDALAASLYNNGKGKTCENLTTAERANLVSCWNFDEDGGPYEDSSSPGSVSKTEPVADWGNASAISVQEANSGDVSVSYTVIDGGANYLMVGLSDAASTGTYTNIDFAAYQVDGDFQVYEGGASKGVHGTQSVGDTITVAVTSGVVTYSVNGELRYTSETSPTYPLHAHTAAYTPLVSAGAVTFNGSAVDWTDEIGMAEGLNPLLGVNAPTQGPGLVEQADSGMGTDLEASSTQAWQLASFPQQSVVSVCAWVNLRTASTNVYLVDNYSAGSGWLLYQSSLGVFRFYATASSNNDAWLSAANANQWYHVCGIHDGVQMELFVDGVGTGTPLVDTLGSQPNELTVGAAQNLATGHVDGAIDAVYVWNFAIGPQGVEAMYADGEGTFY